MSLRRSITPLVLFFMLAASIANAQAPNTITVINVGTLACTTSDASRLAVTDAELSCHFHAFFGTEGSFAGSITRRGPADLPPGERVLVWSVLAQKAEIDLRVLAGTYSGVTGGQPSGLLSGGEGNVIVLQPISITSQIGDTPVPTVLELRLVQARS